VPNIFPSLAGPFPPPRWTQIDEKVLTNPSAGESEPRGDTSRHTMPLTPTNEEANPLKLCFRKHLPQSRPRGPYPLARNQRTKHEAPPGRFDAGQKRGHSTLGTTGNSNAVGAYKMKRREGCGRCGNGEETRQPVVVPP